MIGGLDGEIARKRAAATMAMLGNHTKYLQLCHEVIALEAKRDAQLAAERAEQDLAVAQERFQL